MYMTEALEIQQIIDHLQGVLENLVTRGMRNAGPAERKALATLGAEFARVGAGHLAEHVSALHDALANDQREAPERLLKAQASLRAPGMERSQGFGVPHPWACVLML